MLPSMFNLEGVIARLPMVSKSAKKEVEATSWQEEASLVGRRPTGEGNGH